MATEMECFQNSAQGPSPPPARDADKAMREMLWLPRRTMAALRDVIDFGVPKKTELAALITLEEMAGSFSSTATRSVAAQVGSRSTSKVWRINAGFLGTPPWFLKKASGLPKSLSAMVVAFRGPCDWE